MAILKFCCSEVNPDVTTSNLDNSASECVPSLSSKQLAKAMEMQQKRAKVREKFLQIKDLYLEKALK